MKNERAGQIKLLFFFFDYLLVYWFSVFKHRFISYMFILSQGWLPISL